MKKTILRIAAFTLVLVLMLAFLGVLLKPKRDPEIAVDNLHDEHEGMYGLDKNTLDVLYIGSSHAFSAISPEDIFHDYGITGYVQASSSQRIWQSYFYLEECLYTQSPKVVVLEVYKAYEDGYQQETFNREAIDKMRLSPAKIEAALMAVKLHSKGEAGLFSYLFPTLRYHDRWSELDQEDFDYFTESSESRGKGFLARTAVSPAEFNSSAYGKTDAEAEEIPDLCEEYLDKIRNLCDKNGIRLVLVKVPTCEWNEENALGVQQWADQYGISYYDFNNDEQLRQAVDIDWSKDTLDEGNHLNYAGAMKFSGWMGNYLTSLGIFTDKRQDASYAFWEEDYTYYKKCVTNYDTTQKGLWESYVAQLAENDYEVIVYVPDSMKKNREPFTEGLTELGLNRRRKAVSLLYKGELVVCSDMTKTNEELSPEGLPLPVTVRQAGTADAPALSCIMDKMDLFSEKDGIQIVVLDPVTGKWVETSVWNLNSEKSPERID